MSKLLYGTVFTLLSECTPSTVTFPGTETLVCLAGFIRSDHALVWCISFVEKVYSD